MHHVRLGLVTTGGTIASSDVDGLRTIESADYHPEAELLRAAWPFPETLELFVREPMRKFSEDMVPADWVVIAEAGRDLVEQHDVDGVIFLHGTDTAGFTSAALSFLLADIHVPLVLTGANLPADMPNSDAQTNVRGALAAVRWLPRGTYLCFAGTAGATTDVHLGTTVRKARAQAHAFASPNRGPVARITDDRCQLLQSWALPQEFRRLTAVEPDVAAIVLHPGIDLQMTADALLRSGKRGVVVRMYPGVTGPELAGPLTLPTFVRTCVDQGLTVVTCIEEYVGSDFHYPSGVAMQNAGATFVYDMIWETAFVKLCWALAQESSVPTVEKLMLTPIAGEMR